MFQNRHGEGVSRSQVLENLTTFVYGYQVSMPRPRWRGRGDPLSSRHQRHGMEDEKMLFGVHFRDSPPENVEITFK